MSTAKPQNPNLVDNEIPSIPIAVRVASHPPPIMTNEIVKNFCAAFYPKKSDLQEIMASCRSEMTRSLRNVENAKTDLRMFNTHVCRLPTGKEYGRFLAIDFVGSMHKILLVTFSPKHSGKPIVDQSVYYLPKKYYSCSIDELFDYLAQSVESFLENKGVIQYKWNASFSFPYALVQDSLKHAYVHSWSKNFSVRQMLGADIYSNFQKALNKTSAKVKLHAVLNDCVQLLAASCVGDSECAMAMVLGEGVNAAYVEDLSNFKRDEKFDDNAKFVVINTELSGLGECGSLRRFFTEFDRRLDRLSANPGYQTFEKFVAGCYLGEIVRHMIVFLTEKNQLFGGNLPMSLKNPYTFPTKYICEIERDPPHLFYTTEYILREDLKIPNLKVDDLRIVRYVCSAVAHRSACLAAAAAACIVKGIRRMRVTIGVDGCLVRFHPTYAKQMITVMAHLVPKNCTFRLKLTEEAGKGGAAIVASYMGRKK